MAEITAQVVNEFRKQTGLGLMKCKELLKQADGNLEKALTLAKEQGVKDAGKRAGRATSAGRVEVYVHHDAKMASMVELNCETDFVARNDDFKEFAKDLALHVMAANPLVVSREQLAPEVVAEQKRIFVAQAADKPENIREKIADGKLEAWYGEVCLVDQEFVKDMDRDKKRKVREVLIEMNARTGENVTVSRFARFVVGEAPAAAPESPAE